MDLNKLRDRLDPAHIQVPLEIVSFYAPALNVSEQNRYRETYVTEYMEFLVNAVKRYVLHATAAMFLDSQNLAVLSGKVRSEFEIAYFDQKPTNDMIREVLLSMLVDK